MRHVHVGDPDTFLPSTPTSNFRSTGIDVGHASLCMLFFLSYFWNFCFVFVFLLSVWFYVFFFVCVGSLVLFVFFVLFYFMMLVFFCFLLLNGAVRAPLF